MFIIDLYLQVSYEYRKCPRAAIHWAIIKIRNISWNNLCIVLFKDFGNHNHYYGFLNASLITKTIAFHKITVIIS